MLYPKYIYTIFVAKNYQKETIGFAHFVLHGRDKQGLLRANIGAAVADAYQGRGVGTLIFSKLIAGAKEMGVDILFLDVVAENTSAVRLYEKYGFKTVERKNDQNSRTILKMECKL